MSKAQDVLNNLPEAYGMNDPWPFSIQDLKNVISRFEKMSSSDIQKILKQGKIPFVSPLKKPPMFDHFELTTNFETEKPILQGVYKVTVLEDGEEIDGKIYIQWDGERWTGEI